MRDSIGPIMEAKLRQMRLAPGSGRSGTDLQMRGGRRRASIAGTRMRAVAIGCVLALGLLLGVEGGPRAAPAPPGCLESPEAGCVLKLLLQERQEPSRLLVETLAVAGLGREAREMAAKLSADAVAVVEILELAASGRIEEALKRAEEAGAHLEFNARKAIAATLAWRGRFDAARQVAVGAADVVARADAYWSIAHAQATLGEGEGLDRIVHAALEATPERVQQVQLVLLALARRGDLERAQSVAAYASPVATGDYFSAIRRGLLNLIARGATDTADKILETFDVPPERIGEDTYTAHLDLLGLSYAELGRVDDLKALYRTHKKAFASETFMRMLALAGDAGTALRLATFPRNRRLQTLMRIELAIAAHAAGDDDTVARLSPRITRALGKDGLDPENERPFNQRVSFAAGTGRVGEALELAERVAEDRRRPTLAYSALVSVIAGGDRDQLIEFLRYVERTGSLPVTDRNAFSDVCMAIEEDALRLKHARSRAVARAFLKAARADPERSDYGAPEIALFCLLPGGDIAGAIGMAIAEGPGAARSRILLVTARALLGY